MIQSQTDAAWSNSDIIKFLVVQTNLNWWPFALLLLLCLNPSSTSTSVSTGPISPPVHHGRDFSLPSRAFGFALVALARCVTSLCFYSCTDNWPVILTLVTRQKSKGWFFMLLKYFVGPIKCIL